MLTISFTALLVSLAVTIVKVRNVIVLLRLHPHLSCQQASKLLEAFKKENWDYERLHSVLKQLLYAGGYRSARDNSRILLHQIRDIPRRSGNLVHAYACKMNFILLIFSQRGYVSSTQMLRSFQYLVVNNHRMPALVLAFTGSYQQYYQLGVTDSVPFCFRAVGYISFNQQQRHCTTEHSLLTG